MRKEGPALLVVSVHDVAPSTISDIRWLLARLDELGVAKRVLKVIPAEGGVELDAASELTALLRHEQSRGAEIVLHGYTHRTAGELRGPWLDVHRGTLFAPDDAEFLSLTRDEARGRVRRGRAVLERCALPVSGFCAPGWLAPPWLTELLRAEGFGCQIGLLQIRDLRRRRDVTVPPFGFMGAGAAQERLVGVGGDISLSAHRWLRDTFPHVRAFLHPRGARTSDACLRALERIGRLAAAEPTTTYATLLEGAA